MFRFWLYMVGALHVAAFAIGCGGQSSQPSTEKTAPHVVDTTSPQPTVHKPIKPISPDELIAEFKANEDAANKRYGKSMIEVEGVVKSDSWITLFEGKHSLVLETNPGSELDVHFKTETLGKDPPKIAKGQKIRLRGKADFFNPSLSVLHLENCELVSLEPSK